MSKLTAQGSYQNRLSRPKIYEGKWRVQTRNYYDQDRSQNRYRLNCGNRRMSYRGRAQYVKILEEGQSMIKTIEVILGKAILEENRIIEVRILVMDVEVTLGTIILEEVEVGLEKDRT